MDEVRKALAPLTDWMPPEVRDLLPLEAWWSAMLVAALLGLLLAAHLLRGLWRGAFKRPRREVDWDKPLREVLAECPLPARPPGERELLAYHVPVRVRLVVVAPGGKDVDVDPEAVEALLDRLVPGLTEVALNDQPLLRVWPPQLSHQGFINAFHRCTIKPERDEQLSRWVLLAGRAAIAKQPLFFGLGLWAEQPNTLGRINVEPQQWLDVLRLRPTEK